MKLFRWGRLAPVLLFVLAVAVFVTLFLDGAVKWTVETVGTKANGARVDLGDADVSLLRLSLRLRRLQVTDAGSPMTNAIEVADMRFRLEPKPLFWKKFVIETASIDGIRTGTPRRTSGALPARKKDATEKESDAAVADVARQAGASALGNLKEQYDPKKLITLDNLSSYRKIKEEQDRFARVSQDWQGRVDSVDVEGRAQEARAFADRIKGENFSGAEGVKRAKDVLEQGKKLKAELEKTRNDFNQLKTGLLNEVGQAKDALRQVDELRRQDVESALKDLKAGFSVDGITKGLLGPAWYGKLQNGIRWFHKVRKLIPQKKADPASAPKPVRKGVDVPFPFKYNWPAFHLKTAGLSGATSGDNPLDYKGTLTDVTSDPKLVGRPIALEISGAKADDPRKLALRAEFDYTADLPREAIKFNYRGINLAGTQLGEVGGPVAVAGGMGGITADLEARGEQIAGRIEFAASPIKLQHELTPEQARNRLTALLHEVLTQIDSLDIAFLVSDTISSPNIHIRSSLDKQVGAAVSAAAQKELDEIKAQARARVDELVAGEQKKLADLVNGRVGDVTGKLNKKDEILKSGQDQAQKTLEEITKKASGSLPVPANLPIPGLKKSDPAPADGQAPQEEQKSVTPDLKRIFKRK